MLKAISFLAFVACTFALQVNFKDCGSKGAKINTLNITPCTAEPCTLHANGNYTVEVNFTATENTNTGKTYVYGLIAGVPVPFPLPSDACQNMNCPVKSGTTQVYKNTIFCSPSYPKLRLEVKWEVKDDNKADLFCFVVPLVIA